MRFFVLVRLLVLAMLCQACNRGAPVERGKVSNQRARPVESSSAAQQPMVSPKTTKSHESAKLGKSEDALRGDFRTVVSIGLPGELRTAMDQFVVALRANDTEGFLRWFSSTRTWDYVNTMAGYRSEVSVSYATLKRDLSLKSGLYTTLFNGDGDDCLRDYSVSFYEKPWEWVGGNKFIPPNSDEDTVWIRWRIENGRWVVDAIAQPSA